MNKYIADFSLDNYINDKCADDKEFARHFQYQEFLNNVSQKIYDLRKKAGLTQSQLAELINTKQPVIARLESGDDTKMPSLNTLYRVAEAVGAHININFELKK